MSFLSPMFLFFILFMAIGAVGLHGRRRILFYTVGSYCFYANNFPPHVLLLLTSTLVDYHVGHKLYVTENPFARKCWVTVSLCVNLGVLAVFKYTDFLIELWNQQMDLWGLGLSLPHANLLLPIGISFYTFQTLSYTLDIYRKQLKPTDSFLDFACFVAFFPQLVAGPIVRAKEFLPQIAKAVPFQKAATIMGLELIFLGLFKKAIIADNIAPIVDDIFAFPTSVGGGAIWLGSFLFAIQIYADFSGYTDIARGLARILGFQFPENFSWPYLSRSIQEFWRRWHMTLSFWIRDYLYFSLGGSKVSTKRFMANMVITWALMGLWHGAAMTFVVWGLYHALCLIVHRKLVSMPITHAILAKTPDLVKIFCTFTLVVFGWTAFRAGSIHDLSVMWATMLGLNANFFDGWNVLSPIMIIALALMTVVHFGTHYFDYQAEKKAGLLKVRYPIRVIFYLMLASILVIFAGSTENFIYFAF